MRFARAALGVFAAMTLSPSRAHGDEGAPRSDGRANHTTPSHDPSYGRFDGDLAFVGSLGMTLGPRAPRMTADIRFRYLSTAGLFATYEQGPPLFDDAAPVRVFAAGAEFRPLFLGRWGTGRESGSPRLDLFIDSIAIELGAVFVQPIGARFGARPGLQLGLGMELPFFSVASGPLLGVHGGIRWSDTALSGGPLDGPSDRALYLTIVFGWQQLFGAHVVDMGDRSKTAQ